MVDDLTPRRASVEKLKPDVTSVSQPDHQALLNPAKSNRGRGGMPRKARRALSLSAIGQSVLDITIAIASLYFIVFAVLVYMHKGQPVDLSFNKSLLQAANYASIQHSTVLGSRLTQFRDLPYFPFYSQQLLLSFCETSLPLSSKVVPKS